MDFINDFIHQEYLEAIGWTLIHSTWQIVAVSLLLWFVLKFSSRKSANFRYTAGIIALLVITATSVITFSMMLDTPQDKIAVTAHTHSSGVQVISSQDANFPSTAPTIKSNYFNPTWLQKLEAFLPTLVNLWLLGALFFLVKLSGSLFDLRNLHKKHNQQVPEQLIKKVNSMIASMEFYRKVKVLKSQLVNVPITYGIIKPVILIPAGLLLNTSPQQLEAIIAHELAHIKRYDYLINILQHCLEVFFFFHPCFWWINEIVRTERENACDDVVLGMGFSPQELAYGLAEVAEYAHTATPEMALAATGSTNPTLNRIKRIMGLQSRQEKLSPLITLTMLVSLVISASLVMGAIPSEKHEFSKEFLMTNLKTETVVKNWSVHLPCPDEIKSSSNSRRTYVYSYKTDTTPAPKVVVKVAAVADPMPVLELSPVPQMDVEIPPVPMIPQLEEMDFVPPMPTIELDISEETSVISEIAIELAQMERDTSIQDKQKRAQLQAKLEQAEKKLEAKTKVFEEKMSEWENEHGKTMKEWETKMEAWGKEMELKQKEWEIAFEPKMKEFETKMKAWEKENEPKIKEFEAKMKEWEKRQREKEKQIE
ncbi:M48 family metalloprotease [Echinicola sp. CAU 1574]|uniref:M48 family metalloprotease n=1 Tax=Echinicola arenosa TaxID=2774144 RepID=A0ABR9AI14_9BACT|nr:M56 family metallopeptidase [Echinicola arenosa]MBD8487941.1 M48 family metalloprotease [Echinicola arenosa]